MLKMARLLPDSITVRQAPAKLSFRASAPCWWPVDLMRSKLRLSGR